jgi:hypothetical protein
MKLDQLLEQKQKDMANGDTKLAEQNENASNNEEKKCVRNFKKFLILLPFWLNFGA